MSKTNTSWYANRINNILRLIGLIILITIAVVVYHYFIHDVLKTKDHYFTYFVIIWLILSYGILPHAYRWLSKIFLPNYFIGRTQAGDGMLGDPINLAIIGSRQDLIKAMLDAGWTQADKISIKSSIKISYAAFFGVPYPSAPVSPLFLFNQKQTLAFEKDLGGNPRKRHHARFWETPDDWWLPGGFKADYLGAATFDKNVGLSLFTGQITHKIDANVDEERNFVVKDFEKSGAQTKWVDHFTSSYHSRNGGGDIIHTDGSLPFVTLKKFN